MKKVTKIAILFTVLFITIGIGAYLHIQSLKGYTKVGDFCNDSYYPYGLNKGYEPGSIISIKTHWWFKDRIFVEDLQISRDKLEKELVNKSFLKFTPKTSINQCTYDQTSQFKAAIDQKIIEKSDADKTLLSELAHLAKVNIEAIRGSRYGLADGGGSALHDIITHLPAPELEKLLRVITRGRDLFFITEVIEYDEAVAEFYWQDTLSGESQLEISNLLGIRGIYEWNSRDKLKVNFAEGSIVGFSGGKVLPHDLTLIETVLADRAERGNLIRLYPDFDGDGYGTNVELESKIFGEKEPHIVNNPDGIILYVQNNIDVDDRDSLVNPKSTVWYRDSDGDGYGDASSIKLSTGRPKGYVDNGLDCYDRNANAFPGQTKSFSNHRGDGSFDYDCDMSSTIQSTTNGGCVNGCRTLRNGWEHSPPPCGRSASYVVGCNNGRWPNYNCRVYTEVRTQFCR